MKPLLIFSIALLAFSCGKNKESALNPYSSKCIFKDELKHFGTTNLAKNLGDSITIENNGDTKTFIIQFDRKNNINTIIEKGKGEKFSGTACKYNGLYFLNKRVEGGFQIFVIRSDDHKIQGLTDFENQIKMLDKNIEQGFYKNLIEHAPENGFVLKTDKKEIAKIYSQMLLSLPQWQIKN